MFTCPQRGRGKETMNTETNKDSEPVAGQVQQPVRRRALAGCLAAAVLVAACGQGAPPKLSAVAPRGSDQHGYLMYKTAPDEHGVVCYSTERNSAALSCVKVRLCPAPNAGNNPARVSGSGVAQRSEG